MITLRNDFHNTEVRLRASVGDSLTKSQVTRSRRILCGIKGCKCGGYLAERGPQEIPFTDLIDLAVESYRRTES